MLPQAARSPPVPPIVSALGPRSRPNLLGQGHVVEAILHGQQLLPVDPCLDRHWNALYVVGVDQHFDEGVESGTRGCSFGFSKLSVGCRGGGFNLGRIQPEDSVQPLQ